MNKCIPVFILSLICTQSLFGAYHSNPRYGRMPEPPYQPQPQQSYQQQPANGYYPHQQNSYPQQQNTCAPQQNYCPPQYGWCCPPPRCCGKFTFFMDYLYWRSCTDGVAFALNQKFTGTTERLTETKGGDGLDSYLWTSAEICDRLKFSDEWNSGLRLGVGFKPDCSCWDVALEWIYYEPSGRSSAKANDGYSVIPFPGFVLERELAVEFGRDAKIDGEFVNIFDFYVPFQADLIGDRVRADHRLDLNLVDLELGYKLYCDQCVSFRPHFGLRFASIDQHLRLRTDGRVVAFMTQPPGQENTPEFCADFESRKNLDSSFTGIGPRIGFDSEIGFSCFCLYGNFAISTLYGDRDTYHKENAKRFNFAGSTVFDSENYHFKRHASRCCTHVIADTELGICWKWCTSFCYRNFDIGLKLGWEHHYFFNQSVADAVRNSPYFAEERVDLSTQGLVVGLSLGF